MLETISLLTQVLLWPLCLGMIGLILLQGGAGDISSAFGAGGMLDSTLGVGASKKMAKVTGWLAAAFFAFVLFLAIPHKGGYGVKSAGPATGSGQGAKPAGAVPAPGSEVPVIKPDTKAPVAPAQPVIVPTASSPALVPPSAPVIQSAVDAAKAQAEAAVAQAEAAAAQAKAAIEAAAAQAKATAQAAVQVPAAPAVQVIEAPKVEAPAVPIVPAPAK